MLVRAVGITSEPMPLRAESSSAVAGADRVRWLVLSADHETRDVVGDAVRRNGGACHAVHGGSGPSRSLVVRPYHYAFIDILHPPGDGSGINGWADALRLHRCRLVIRAADGDLAGERWARERGAVIYLPGRLDAAGLQCLLRELERHR